MPEVQKPVLEHAAPEAHQNQGLVSRVADDSLPDSTLVAKPGIMATPHMSEIPFIYKVPTESLENPSKIRNITVTLPSGATADFIISGGWISPP